MATFTADEKNRLFEQLDEIVRAVKGTNGTPGLLGRMETQEGKMKMVFAIGGGIATLISGILVAVTVKMFEEMSKVMEILRSLPK
jgi:hypothetical protein